MVSQSATYYPFSAPSYPNQRGFHSRGRKAEADADNVDDEVVVTERAQLPEDEADDEDEAAEDVEAG